MFLLATKNNNKKKMHMQLYKQRQQGSPGLRLAALPHASADQLFSLAFATVSAYGVSHWWKQNRATEPLDLVSRWR